MVLVMKIANITTYDATHLLSELLYNNLWKESHNKSSCCNFKILEKSSTGQVSLLIWPEH